MSAKTRILEIETALIKLDSDLDFELAQLNSANVGLAAAFETGDTKSVETARERVNARTYDVECLCESKRETRSRLPALRLRYMVEEMGLPEA